MRTSVDHTVWFTLEEGEGATVPAGDRRYARVDGITVHLYGDGRVQVHAGGMLCRKDGTDDKRRGRTITSVTLPDEAEWVERAKALV